jgi:SAM-dependent methyltransferase
MNAADLELIKQINRLWKPVYPHLGRQIQEFYGRRNGKVLEIGPFSGVIFSLTKDGVGDSSAIASFPTGMADSYQQEAREAGLSDRIQVVESDSTLGGIDTASIDLAIFRGAFFFPSIFECDLAAIERVLKPGGMAFVGGGFGKYTPNNVLLDLGKQSRELNLSIGKIEITGQALRKMVADGGLKAQTTIIEEGGLWVLIRK